MSERLFTHLPGTSIEADLEKSDAEYILYSIFSTGGLVLSQVSQLTGAEPHDIQNWIKRGFCSSPVAKKYSRKQFCRIVIINTLREVMNIRDITTLLSYINGYLDDEKDDMIDDDVLYVYFVKALSFTTSFSDREVSCAVESATAGYKEPFAGGAERLRRVLKIMVYVYFSSVIKKRASIMMSSLGV